MNVGMMEEEMRNILTENIIENIDFVVLTFFGRLEGSNKIGI